MSRAFRFAVTSLTAVLVLMAGLGVAHSAVSKGQKAPNFKLKGLDGKTYQLSSYKGKKAVAISFWAVWCPPCQKELPELEKVWKKVKSKPVQILGINVDGQMDVAANVKKNGLTFPVMIDTANVSREYGVRGIPTLVIVDKAGVVREIFVGYNPNMATELPKLLERYSK